MTARDPWEDLPPSPPRVVTPTEEEIGRANVLARSGGNCERCGASSAGHWHHRKTRGRGGDWSAANGLQLCNDCHDWTHRNTGEAYREGLLVRTEADPEDVPVLLRTRLRGRRWALLDALGNWTEALW